MSKTEKCSCPLCGGSFTPDDGTTADEHLAIGILKVYKEMQGRERYPCPRCGSDTMSDKIARNALSRIADVQICDACGTDEALRAVNDTAIPITEWWAVREILLR
jgi:predicted RNA-binding Zn-ribbon protein involved in translation (DUF1610 family)